MKPIITTTEPCFMGGVGDLSHAEKYMRDDRDAPNGVSAFIHGELEAMCGYDIPVLCAGTITGEHGQECLVVTPTGEEVEAFINLIDCNHYGRPLYYVELEKRS